MKKLFFYFLFLLISYSTAAQTKFRKVIGNDGYDKGMSAVQVLDTGYVALGSTSSEGYGSTDIFFIRTDSMGIVKGTRTFGGINVDIGTSIRQTADSGFVICGYTNSFGYTGYNIYLAKLDKAYQTTWAKVYGGTDWDFGYCVRQTADGGFILCGSTYSYGSGGQDYYLIKTDANGDTTWTRTYGGVNDDVANSVAQTADGGYVLTGYSMSLGDTLGDIYTVRTDSNGDTLWTNRYGAMQADKGNSVIESMTGNIMVAGEATTAGNTDGILVQLSPLGAYMSNYVFPSGSSYDNFNYVSEDSQGKFAMVGLTKSLGLNGDMQVVILKSNLGFYNATTFGTINSDDGYSIEPTNDKGFIICGYTDGYNNGLDDVYLIKTDTNGLSNSTGSETFYTTGVNETVAAEMSALNAYPNPASGIINVPLGGIRGELSISIYDMLGREVKRTEYSSNSEARIPVDVSALPEGVYSVTLLSEAGTFSQRIVIRH